MRTRRRALLACGLLLGLATLPPAVAAEAETPAGAASAAGAKPGEPSKSAGSALAPYLAMRSLQRLQDQVAHGNTAAQSAQPRSLVHVAEVFAAADPALWKEPRNADAVALYLFSAGRATVVRALIKDGAAFTPDGDRLVKGALAYAEGQDDIARALLGGFDPKAMPASLGGHLALVLATIFADKDPARSATMLDVARLLVPGTLVEEAALRRQIFLLADALTLDKFTALSRQYLRRFRGSVFASNFRGRLTSFAVRLAVAGDVAQLAKLESVFSELPKADRRGLYLTLSRDALLAGRPDAARYAAAAAAALAPDPAEAERARLYTAAADAASDAAPTVRATLASLDGARLPARDAELRDAAAAVAASVDAGLGDQGQDAGRDGATPDGSAMTLIERARRAMAAGDALLAVADGPHRAPGDTP